MRGGNRCGNEHGSIISGWNSQQAYVKIGEFEDSRNILALYPPTLTNHLKLFN
jgi:hypothetical protein